jgi:putative ABC transport system permease protein
MKLALYWRYATRSLIRGGQRTFLAIFCITIGVMSIVALQLVGNSIDLALTGNIRDANGGDIHLSDSIIPLKANDLAFFDNLKSSGQISEYATSTTYPTAVTMDDGSEVDFMTVVVSANYPLISQPHFTSPSSQLRMQDIVKENNVVISDVVAKSLHVSVNDHIVGLMTSGQKIDVIVGAIYKQGGAYDSRQIFASQSWIQTVPLPTGQPAPVQYTAVNVATDHPDQVKKQLEEAFPTATVTTTADQMKQQQENIQNIRLFLQVVGLLALFIGGIGIINTMQVLLRRRQVEIAMLKTTGYRQGDLLALFGLEATLLGLVGGILGAGLGVGVSTGIRALINNLYAVDLPVSYDFATIVSGVYIGVFTALIFGLLPIISSSQVRPIEVLRGLVEEKKRGSFLWTVGLLALLTVFFVALAATIMGDIVRAAVIIYGGILLVGAMAAGFSLLVLAISKLPVYERPSPRILLWVLSALGMLVLSGLATGILSGIGFAASKIASQIGQGGLGVYLVSVCVILGLILVGGAVVFLLAVLLDTFVMFLPRTWKSVVMLAYRNIGRQRVRTTTTLTILFVSVFAIGLVVIMGQGIKEGINNTFASLLSRNVYVMASPNRTDTVTNTLAHAKGVDQNKTIQALVGSTQTSYQVVSINDRKFSDIVASLTLKTYRNDKNVGQLGVYSLTNSIQGFNLASTNKDELPPSGKDQFGQQVIVAGQNLTKDDIGTNNILVGKTLMLDPVDLKVGDTITVTSLDGKMTKVMTIKGFYDDMSATVAFGTIWADQGLVTGLCKDNVTVIYEVKIDPNTVTDLRKTLKTVAPDVYVLNLGDITAIIGDILNKLIIMLTTISSLVMISGLIIIANAVALAMLERRREIGILKTVGHSTNTVLATVVLENALVGLLGSLVAMVLVGGTITLLNKVAFHDIIPLNSGLFVLIIGGTALLTMGIASTVAYSAARVRPLQVLRYE